MTARIFLHGFTGSPESFATLLELGGSDRVFAPALLGHDPAVAYGGLLQAFRAERSPRSFEREVDRIAALIRARGLRGAHVFGYSLGARVALGLCVAHPELVSRATLLGVNPGLRSAEERAQRRAGDAEWCRMLEQRGLSAFIECWQNQALFMSQASLPQAVLDTQRRERLRHSVAGLCLALASLSLAEMPNYWPELAGLSVPIDLVVGALDRKFCELATEARRHLRRGTLHVVPNSGHNVLLERPATLQRVLACD